MSKRDEHDVADALLAKAVGDEAGLRALTDHHDVPDHVAGFLAQQAIEKALKAVLLARDVPFERRHNIDYLCSLIEDAGLDQTPELKAAVALTPWAVESVTPILSTRRLSTGPTHWRPWSPCGSGPRA